MKTAFDQPKGSANFDKIAPRTPDDYLYISQIFHKTFIAVDEKGTEAAAATAVAMMAATAFAITSSAADRSESRSPICLRYSARAQRRLFVSRARDRPAVEVVTIAISQVDCPAAAPESFHARRGRLSASLDDDEACPAQARRYLKRSTCHTSSLNFARSTNCRARSRVCTDAARLCLRRERAALPPRAL